MKKSNVEAVLYIEEFQMHFNENYLLLCERYRRFVDIINDNNIKAIDVETYLDMILVQLRSLLLDDKWDSEKKLKNYTVQSILSMCKDTTIKNKIDQLLDTVILKGPENCKECLVSYDCDVYRADCYVMSDLLVRDVIKQLTDKTICHYENNYKKNSYSWEYFQMLKDLLIDKKEPHNIFFIMDTLMNILLDGIDLQFDN